MEVGDRSGQARFATHRMDVRPERGVLQRRGPIPARDNLAIVGIPRIIEYPRAKGRIVIAIDDLAILDDGIDLAGVQDVLQRIGVEDKDVRKLALFDRTDIVDPKAFRHPFRRRLNGLHRRQADIFDEHRELLMQAKPRGRLRDIRRRHDLAAGINIGLEEPPMVPEAEPSGGKSFGFHPCLGQLHIVP